MNRQDLKDRMLRLEELIRGLFLEASLWRTCSAPIMALDRMAYMGKARVTCGRRCHALVGLGCRLCFNNGLDVHHWELALSDGFGFRGIANATRLLHG